MTSSCNCPIAQVTCLSVFSFQSSYLTPPSPFPHSADVLSLSVFRFRRAYATCDLFRSNCCSKPCQILEMWTALALDEWVVSNVYSKYIDRRKLFLLLPMNEKIKNLEMWAKTASSAAVLECGKIDVQVWSKLIKHCKSMRSTPLSFALKEMHIGERPPASFIPFLVYLPIFFDFYSKISR